MIKKWLCLLFGKCIHRWSKWTPNWVGPGNAKSSYEQRECLECGKREERYV